MAVAGHLSQVIINGPSEAVLAVAGHVSQVVWKGSKALPFDLVFFFFYFPVCNSIVPMRFLPWEIRIAFLWESQLRRSRATQAMCILGVLVFP